MSQSWTLARMRAWSHSTLRLPMIFLGCCLFLVGCDGTLSPQGPEVRLVSMVHKPTGEEIITTIEERKSFFSRHNLRQTVFSGQIDARLANPGERAPGGSPDLGGVNTPARNGAASEFQTEIKSDDIYFEPLRSQQVLGGQWQPKLSGGSVSLRYDNDPLETVTRDILGGILGVNYILSENIQGTVSFRSEQAFARGELLQILSDILARNGYLIQYFNSIYHVGRPDELDVLTGLRGRTALEGDETYVIRLRRAPPTDLAEIVSALIPPGNTFAAIPGSLNFLVRGDPTQFKSIEDLVVSLVGTGARRNILAILPLRRSAPEVIADQMGAVYAARNLGDAIFLPLVQRQGILVVASSQKEINTARRIVRGLDFDNRDTPKLRIIPLSYLNATEIADQLGQVFGVSTTEQEITPSEPSEASNIIAAAEAAAAGGDTAEQTRATPETTESTSQAAASTATSAEGLSISANSRNNMLLVRSTYDDFKRISAVLETLDVSLAQVVIEATIIEVLLNDSLQYGVQAFLQRTGGDTFRTSSSTGAGDTGGAGFTAVLSTLFGNGQNSAQAVVTALQSVSNVKVISSPYLTVEDGSSSRLSVGDEIPFVTASQTSNSSGTVTVTQEVETRDVGVILEVTPKISPDNSVTLTIAQEVSSVAAAATTAGTNPTLSTRTIESQISVNSGSTVLLAGMIQERSDISEDGVPVLRKIPLLGEIFKQRADNQRRSELLVLITPRVVRNNSQITKLTDQLKWALSTR